jgi:hypothetical protein
VSVIVTFHTAVIDADVKTFGCPCTPVAPTVRLSAMRANASPAEILV